MGDSNTHRNIIASHIRNTGLYFRKVCFVSNDVSDFIVETDFSSFVCKLFNDAASISVYTALNDCIILNNTECRRIWKEVLVA
jgi:hypothetical protein